MRVHFVLNHGGTPVSKLADVEIHFEEGLLAGLKLVGCSVWKSKKGEAPTVLVPSRSYATASTGPIVNGREILKPHRKMTPEERERNFQIARDEIARGNRKPSDN